MFPPGRSWLWLGCLAGAAMLLLASLSSGASSEDSARPHKDPEHHATTPEPDSDSESALPPKLKLPFCPPPSERHKPFRNSNVLLVATLDGGITALDPATGGTELWRMRTAPGDMVSSTISSLELTSSAKLVRLIPSLGGGLYKFDGETVEPVPLNAETLLRASFKFADNTIITGGKETRTYGLDVDSGQVRYECSISGCDRRETGSLDDVLVVQRETQVVRAVEPRSGQEKWNFSVSQHTLDLQSGVEDLCDDDDDDKGKDGDGSETEDDADDAVDEQIKAVVSDGIICSVEKARPDLIKWSHKFNSPIVHAWRVVGGKVVKVDLFSSSALPPRQPVSLDDPNFHVQTPLLYIGSHNKQLYIQESDALFEDNADKMRAHQLLQNPDAEDTQAYPKVTWRPYLISSASRTPVINHDSRVKEQHLIETNSPFPLLTYDDKVAESTALAVFTGSEYPYDSGFYLFPEEPDLKYDPILDYDSDGANTKGSGTVLGEASAGGGGGGGGDTYTIQVVFMSLWYWWKEVVLISFLTAVFMNVLITRPLVKGLKENFSRKLAAANAINQRKAPVVIVEVPVQVPAPPAVPSTASTAGHNGGSTGSLTNSEFSWDRQESSETFTSRYLQDFEPVQCLGKGGFGVVFEAKNRLDDINYAVKRIRLPKVEEARRKVMREVKFLAKLDHKNIVRYFNTWLERPPAGWQESQDRWWREAVLNAGGHSINLASSLTQGFTQTGDESASAAPFGGLSSDGDDDSSLGGELTRDFSLGGPLRDNNDSFSIVFEKSKSEAVASKASAAPSKRLEEGARSPMFTSMSSSSSSDCNDALEWEANKKPAPSKAEEASEDAYLYIVMQLCRKESLKDWLRNCTVERTRARSLELFEEICHGVEYVHAQGLIHRDLKPSNIFFSTEGGVKIGDFGLVTGQQDPGCSGDDADDASPHLRTRNQPNIHQHTDQVGTELYMSPEQVEKRPYNHKVDVYSLGLILFEMLVPFSTQMERAHVLSGLRRKRFPGHFLNAPEFPLVKAMLAHDPEERPEVTGVLKFVDDGKKRKEEGQEEKKAEEAVIEEEEDEEEEEEEEDSGQPLIAGKDKSE